ncbi:MAG: serine acetyltransferase [Bacillota bacterium]
MLRERIIDYSKGDDLRRFWTLFQRRKRAKSKLVKDILTFLCNRSAHRHGGYIGNGARLDGILSLPHGLHGVYIFRFARIGAGAVVTGDVPDCCTVLTPPLRVIEREREYA